MKGPIAILILLLLNLSDLRAQLDNRPFITKDTIYGEKNDLFVNIKSLSFNRNDEYYTKFADGQTFFGYQFEPSFEYNLTDKISLTAGVFATKDFGNSKFEQVQPIYKLKVATKSGLLIFGNIQSHLNHRYIEPIYDFRSILKRPRENGIQYLINKKKWNSDLWIDWQKNIYEGSDFLEEIYGGTYTEYVVSDSGKFRLTVPLQLLLFHEGGQIDVSPDPLQLKSNTALGFKISLPQKGWLDKIETDNHIIYYRDHMIDDDWAFHEGFGVYANLSFYKKHHSLMFSYWNGNEFMGIRGAPIFYSQSQSFRATGFRRRNRQLLFIRFISNYKLSEDINLSLRVEPNFDLNQPLSETFDQRIMDFSHALYINLEKRFFVKNIRTDKGGTRK